MSNSPLFGIKKEIANRDPRPRVLAQPPSTACSIFNLVYTVRINVGLPSQFQSGPTMKRVSIITIVDASFP
jgi:hypothetical protein